MARLFDLSNELILLVSDFVNPPDHDSWFLVAKRIRELHQMAIEEHLRNKSRYKRITHFRWGDREEFEGCEGYGTLANLCKEMILSPRTAAYVECLSIERWHMTWSRRGVPEDQRRGDMTSEENAKVFEKALRNSRCVSAKDLDEHEYMDTFHLGREDQVVGLLLTLVPNLMALEIHLPDATVDYLSETIESIAKLPKPDALTQLTRVTLSSHHCQTSLHLISAFAALPSMQQIYADAVVGPEESSDFQFQHSEVTTLSLTSCDVSSETLFDFLCAFKRLTKFEFTTRFALFTMTNAYEPFWILAALRSHSSHSLEKLTMRGNCDLTKAAPMGPLRSLSRLQELDTDIEALFGGHSVSDLPDNFLPTSISSITLRHEVKNTTVFTDLVKSLLFLKRDKQTFIYLRSLQFIKDDGKGDPGSDLFRLKAACAAADISLTLE